MTKKQQQYKQITQALKQKALKLACFQIRKAKTREEANKVYLYWLVFKSEPLFVKEIEEKQKFFNNNNKNK